MTTLRMRVASLLVLVLSLAGCTAPAKKEDSPHAQKSPGAVADFRDRVWRVTESNGVEPGMTYIWKSDGTLAIASPHGTPAFGTWRRNGQRLIMVEEDIEYPVDILESTADHFRIVINNPGTPTELTMVPDQP
ncbi:MAG TPA: hypothetical protein VF720_03745 [Candidatus Eisenbacteria bacterium]